MRKLEGHIRKKIVEKYANALELSVEQKEILSEVLACIPRRHAVCYFAAQDLRNGVSPTIICDRYKITIGELRGIGRRNGYYKLKQRYRVGVEG